MMRHNEEGLVRQMCDAGAVGAAFIVSAAFVPCRLKRASKARLECGEPGLESEPASDTVHHKFRYHTAQTGGSSGTAVYPYLIAGSRDAVCTPGHISEGLVQVRDRALRSSLSRRTRIR